MLSVVESCMRPQRFPFVRSQTLYGTEPLTIRTPSTEMGNSGFLSGVAAYQDWPFVRIYTNPHSNREDSQSWRQK